MTDPDRASQPDDLAPRISTGRAAKYLGVSTRHIQKLIDCKLLAAWDVSLPGSKRPRYAVREDDVRRLLVARRQP